MPLETLPPPSEADMSFASGVAKLAAQDWQHYCRGSATRFKVVSRIVSEAFGEDMKGKRILDWGSSLGGVAILMKEHHHADVTAADVDRHALGWLQQTHGDIRTVVLEPSAGLPFEDNIFDAIYGISVLTHIPPELQEHYLSELYRIVKPDGIVILTVKSYDSIEVAKGENKRAGLHPENKAALDEAGLFYTSYPDRVLQKMEFTTAGDYGIAYHSSDYIVRIFGKWFDIDGTKPSKIGQQDVLTLMPKNLAVEAVTSTGS